MRGAIPSGSRRLLEREGEREGSVRAVAGAAEGAGQVLLIEGPPGIGKTALLDALAELARRRGLAVLRARGNVLEQDLPWGVVRQLLTKRLVDAGPEDRAELLRDA